MSSEERMANVAVGQQYRRRIVLSAVLLSILATAPSRGAAAESTETGVGRTPPRLSVIVGNVSFWRPGTDDWVAAQLNMALAPGDALYAGAGARAEVQIGGRAFARLGDDAQLTIVSQEPDFLQLRIGSGRAALDLRELTRGHTVQIDTANAAVTVEDPGYYRFDVTQDATTLITRRGGRAHVQVTGQPTTDVGPNDSLVIEGTDAPQLAVYNAPALDDWDQWNYARTDRLLAAESARYLPRDVYGAETLDDYGTWRVEPTYGRVWVPSDVSAGWAPYSAGQWVWDGYYGWTWVDAAPWGWAPFHYGRWVYLRNSWGWAPGPIVARPVYAPALVAFFGGPGFRVGIGAPFISWVALGWGEPLVPWWGGPGFVGVPCWHGWGGPRIFNNVFVNHTTIVNVHRPTGFVNTRVRDAIITVPRDGFGARPVDRLRTRTPSPATLRPLGGGLPVRPAALTSRRPASERPRGAAPAAPAGFDATHSPSGGHRPHAGTTLEQGHLPPPGTGTGSEQRRPSSVDLQQAPRVVPDAYEQRPSGSEVRREAAPPPPQVRQRALDSGSRPRPPLPSQSGGERRMGPGHGSGGAESTLPPRRPAPPPARDIERQGPQGSFSAPQPPRVEERRQPAAPAPMSVPAAPPAGSAPVAPQRSFGGQGQTIRPHAPAASRMADAPPAAAPAGAGAAPMHAPHPSGGSAPASRGHAVDSR